MTASGKLKWLLAGLLCLALWPAHPFAQTGQWEKYMAAADAAYQTGNFAEAEKQFGAALKEAVRFGPKDTRLATSLNNLAFIYKVQGKYADAEPLYERSLAIVEETLGLGHPRLATSLDNLAGLHHEQGNYAEAEPLYKRSMAVREKALGPGHPDVAQSLNNLAELYYEQGRYAEAEPLYKRALAIWEKALGPDHFVHKRHVKIGLAFDRRI